MYLKSGKKFISKYILNLTLSVENLLRISIINIDFILYNTLSSITHLIDRYH